MPELPTTFCKTPESVIATMGLSQWPDGVMPWTITDVIPRMNEAELRRACVWGLHQWEIVCGVKPVEADRASQARILITCQRIDGPGGVLAQCELPSRGSRYVRLWLDVGEDWETVIPAMRAIYLANVLWHEFGHAIGIGHAPERSNNVMAPVYDPSITAAGQWDIAEGKKRYGASVWTGQPLPPSQPPTNPAPPNNGGNMGFIATLLKFFSQMDPQQLAQLLTLIKTLMDAFGKMAPAERKALVQALQTEVAALKVEE